MPSVLNPTQTPSGTDSNPGSTMIPVALIDQVTPSSIQAIAQAAINNPAYLEAKGSGPLNAPPNAQSPAEDQGGTGAVGQGYGAGSGVRRIQTDTPLDAGGPGLAAMTADDGDTITVPGFGAFQYISPLYWNPATPGSSPTNTPTWSSGTAFAVGYRLFAAGVVWTQITHAGNTGTAPTFSGNFGGFFTDTGSNVWFALTAIGSNSPYFFQTAAPSWAAGTYARGQYVTGGGGYIWLCTDAGSSTTGAFDNPPSPTPGDTYSDPGGAVFTNVLFVGQWVATNAASLIFANPANLYGSLSVAPLAANTTAITAISTGTGAGISATGGSGGTGGEFFGGSAAGNGIIAHGTGSGQGVQAQGGPGGGAGVQATAGTGGPGLIADGSAARGPISLIGQNPAPTDPLAGEVYYDSSTNGLYYWNGSAWQPLIPTTTGGSGENGLLVETNGDGYVAPSFTPGINKIAGQILTGASVNSGATPSFLSVDGTIGTSSAEVYTYQGSGSPTDNIVQLSFAVLGSADLTKIAINVQVTNNPGSFAALTPNLIAFVYKVTSTYIQIGVYDVVAAGYVNTNLATTSVAMSLTATW